MLAHLKAREMSDDSKPESAVNHPTEAPAVTDDEKKATQVTCDVLCSLSASYAFPPTEETLILPGKRKPKTCPKQHQLPMFLSKTYHMIDRCDSTVATWSMAGDNFVVKNVEKFASSVLPLYFKHSNFSSFARQLNFYGFRKLRTDPILTSDVDPRTACYVRFYHEKFQKDRPELLHQIKRATKSDQQSKDDVDSLKLEVIKLKDCIGQMSTEMDRKLAEMSYEYNRRITTLSAEYDKLAALVTQVLTRQPQTDPALALHNPAVHSTNPGESLVVPGRVPDLMHSLSQVAAMSLHNQLRPPPSLAAAVPSGTALGAVATSTLGAAVSAAPSPRVVVGTKRPAAAPAEDGGEATSTRPRMN